jgi:predicted metalloendopeptidase
MVEWWAPSVADRFENRAECVVDQYSKYEVVPGVMQNGELTLGENIADIGGLKASFRAWRSQAGEAPRPSIDGLTEEQLFFVSFAQGWCFLATPEYRKMRAVADSHADPVHRVNGVVSNTPEFHEAFGCDVGTPMHPEKTCEIW